MSRYARLLAAFSAIALVVAACSDDKDEASDSSASSAEQIDYNAIGLWDDGQCDASKPKLVIGLMTVFESPFLSLKPQADALTASAEAFNQRGGANGSCIEVHNCDDGTTADQAVACVREIDTAGVVATVNDLGSAGQADVSAAMAQAGIPRVASNVTPDDWADPNAYPINASGTGVTFMQPQALIDQNVKEIGVIRVGLAEASALVSFLGHVYEDDGATFPFDAPVPTGTTDYTPVHPGRAERRCRGRDRVARPAGGSPSGRTRASSWTRICSSPRPSAVSRTQHRRTRRLLEPDGASLGVPTRDDGSSRLQGAPSRPRGVG